MAHDVFLSYSAADKDSALAVLAGLENQGIRCWIAPRDIPAGSEYGEQIVDSSEGLPRLRGGVFDAANASPHVRREVERAVSMDRPIVPFRVENVAPSGAMEYCLSATHWLDAFTRPVEPHVAHARHDAAPHAGCHAPQEDGRRDARAARRDRVSIAVLPFNNMSGDAEQEYFSDGITEDIITDLSKVSGLFVVARNTAFTYKGKSVKVQEVSRELDVKFVLEGSVRKAGARVSVTGQLINGETGGHVWADRYDRDLTDIFAIQDEITHAIVEQLKVKLLPQERNRSSGADRQHRGVHLLPARPPILPPALEVVLPAGAAHVRQGRRARPHVRARLCGHRRLRLLPVPPLSRRHRDRQILATSAQALALDAGLAEAHASRGLALSLVQKYDEAMTEFERAISLDPTSFEAHYFWRAPALPRTRWTGRRSSSSVRPSSSQTTTRRWGCWDDLSVDRPRSRVVGVARKVVERAETRIELHPENPRPAYLGAGCLISLGERDRAREWLSRAMAIDPDDVLTQYNVACVSRSSATPMRHSTCLSGCCRTRTTRPSPGSSTTRTSTRCARCRATRRSWSRSSSRPDLRERAILDIDRLP